jgi:hypothetical protein
MAPDSGSAGGGALTSGSNCWAGEMKDIVSKTELARLGAVRVCWARLAIACGLKPTTVLGQDGRGVSSDASQSIGSHLRDTACASS